MYTTNYYNTFISVSKDCPLAYAEEPPKKEQVSIARALFEITQASPYTLTSDNLIVQAHVMAKDISAKDLEQFTHEFYSKKQPCLRCCSLVKRYGWGIHYNQDGYIALVPLGSDSYNTLLQDDNTEQKQGMKSKR